MNILTVRTTTSHGQNSYHMYINIFHTLLTMVAHLFVAYKNKCKNKCILFGSFRFADYHFYLLINMLFWLLCLSELTLKRQAGMYIYVMYIIAHNYHVKRMLQADSVAWATWERSRRPAYSSGSRRLHAVVNSCHRSCMQTAFYVLLISNVCQLHLHLL